MIDSFHSKPIATIYQRRSPLWFFDEKAKVVWFIRVIKTLYTALRYNTAIVGLSWVSILMQKVHCELTPIMESSCDWALPLPFSLLLPVPCFRPGKGFWRPAIVEKQISRSLLRHYSMQGHAMFISVPACSFKRGIVDDGGSLIFFL